MVTPEQRERALQHFEAGFAQIPREQLPMKQMRWHCRMRDPQGQVFVVAEYRIRADGSYTRRWVLPDALWPSPTQPELA